MSFKISSLALAVATLSTVSIANAAGLDRSTQPSWAFTEEGTFAYVEHITIDPTIEGKDNKNVATTDADFAAGRNVPDMADDYQFLNFGAKADVNDTISVGAFFDQPWGADVEYSGDNNFVGAPTAIIGANTAKVYSGATQLLKAINPNATAVTSAADYTNAVNTFLEVTLISGAIAFGILVSEIVYFIYTRIKHQYGKIKGKTYRKSYNMNNRV